MKPILLNFGELSISSFGLFLVLAMLATLFTIWRLAKVYDLDETAIFDITMITFASSFIFARLIFVILNWQYFQSLERIFWLTRYPGLSFWGGLIGGLVTLIFLTLRSKINLWVFLDIFSAAILLSLAIGSFGCFLGGCEVGTASQAFFATPVVGVIGKRLPVSIFESVLFLYLFWKLWVMVIRFHFYGKVFSLFLIFLGIVKILADFFKAEPSGVMLPILSIISGGFIFYHRSKRDIRSDLKTVPEFFTQSKRREMILLRIKKSWYNHQVAWRFAILKIFRILRNKPGNFIKLNRLKRRINVKSTPANIK